MIQKTIVSNIKIGLGLTTSPNPIFYVTLQLVNNQLDSKMNIKFVLIESQCHNSIAAKLINKGINNATRHPEELAFFSKAW